MSSQRDELTPVYNYTDSQQQNENILARRNRLLTEENESFRKQIEELTPFRTQYYNLRTSIDHYDTNIAELQQQNEQMKVKWNQMKQFEAAYNEQQATINQLKSSNELLQNELANEQKQNFGCKQLALQISKLQKENQDLQVWCLIFLFCFWRSFFFNFVFVFFLLKSERFISRRTASFK